jgi:hypothetical protein
MRQVLQGPEVLSGCGYRGPDSCVVEFALAVCANSPSTTFLGHPSDTKETFFLSRPLLLPACCCAGTSAAAGGAVLDAAAFTWGRVPTYTALRDTVDCEACATRN